jgi:FkbM family methyltransferase
MKELIKKLARRMNLIVVHECVFGVSPEVDLKRLTHSRPIRTIFDVGGNHGQSAVRFCREFPQTELYTFEPVPANYRILQSAIAPFSQIRPFNIGLGDQKTTLKMGLSDNPGGHSVILAETATDIVEVPVDTIDNVMKEQQVEKIDFMKMDVEGFELSVLKGAEEALSQGKIRFIYTECVFGHDEALPHTSFFDLHETLAKYDFCFFACYSEGFDLKQGVSMGNVLFAHRPSLPESVPGKVRNII